VQRGELFVGGVECADDELAADAPAVARDQIVAASDDFLSEEAGEGAEAGDVEGIQAFGPAAGDEDVLEEGAAVELLQDGGNFAVFVDQDGLNAVALQVRRPAG